MTEKLKTLLKRVVPECLTVFASERPAAGGRGKDWWKMGNSDKSNDVNSQKDDDKMGKNKEILFQIKSEV